MAILFASNEDIDFNLVSSAPSTDSNTYRTDYARGSLKLTTDSSIVWQAFTGQTEVWFQCRFRTSSAPVSSRRFIVFGDGFSSPAIGLTWIASTNLLRIETWNGASWDIQATSVASVTSGVLYKLTVYIDYSATGTVTVWIDDTEFVSFSGDNTGSSESQISTFNMGHVRTSTYYSEAIAATEDPRSLSVKTLFPNGVGTTTQWTGAYTDVDEFTESTGDVISSNSSGNLNTFAMSNLTAGNEPIKTVFVSAKALRTSTGPQNIQMAIRSSGVDYFSSTQPLTTSYSRVVNEWSVDPDTGISWLRSAVDDFEAGVKSIA